MRLLRQRRLLRTALAAALVLAGAALALLAMRERTEYVPGTMEAGLVDSLGRALPSDRPGLRFTDVTTAAGIDFRHFPTTRTNRLPEDMGSGVALGDVDLDGWTDVFLANVAGPIETDLARAPREARCALFRNRGDGSFEDASASSGADLALLANGAAFADVDSDGDLDLVVSAYRELRLLANDGLGRFADVTHGAGLAGFDGFWTGIAVGDADRDGDVDLYVCGYVRFDLGAAAGSRVEAQYGVDIPIGLNPSAHAPERNLYFENDGYGRFVERARELGIANENGRSLGATFADLSGDGWPDLYVANDVSDNAFFVNRGDGSFEDRATQALVADYRGAMGLAVADFDGDLDLDFVVTHWLAQENALYVNQLAAPGAGDVTMFMDQADRYGLGQLALDKVGWATRFFDLDNDGALDLFVVNGSTVPAKSDVSRLAPQKSQLFWNAGRERGFFEIGAVAGDFFSEAHVGRGGATFDFDLDGDEDLLVTVHGDRPRLLRNDGGDANASIRVRLRQPGGNRFAIGARIAVHLGQRTLVDETDTQGSYLSQHAVGEVAFGLGAAPQADQVVVTWPDGASESFGPVPVRSLVTWTRGSAPRVEILPGRVERALAGPSTPDEKRRFFDVLDRASKLRIAGELAQAIAAYEQALAMWPAHEDALYNLGNCWLGLGKRREARAAYERLVSFHPRSSRGWMQIGSLSLADADGPGAALDAAERAFRTSHEINAEESGPVVQLGVCAIVRGDLASADEWLADALVLNATSVEATYFRARIAWLRGDAERARELLAKAHELASAKPPAAPAGMTSEGDTTSGRALLSDQAARAANDLERWKTLLDRAVDPVAEFGPRER